MEHTGVVTQLIQEAVERPHPQHKVPTGLLSSARDWQLKVDLGKLLKFPEHIANTALRPEMVLTSDCKRQVVL